MKLLVILFFVLMTEKIFSYNTNVMYKADCFLSLNKPEKALDLYMELLKTSPFEAIVLNRVGFALFSLNQFKESIRYFTDAIFYDPFNAAYWNNRGAAYSKLKQYDLAETNFSRALKLNNDNPRYLYNMSVVCFRKKRFKESLSYIMQAYKIDSKYVKQRFDRDKVLEEIKKMRKENPSDKDLIEIEKLLTERHKVLY